MTALLLILAILSIVVANIFKVVRLNLFIDPYEHPNSKTQIRALSVASLLNSILPLRLGYIARVWISGKKMIGGRSFMLAAVIVEVVIDFICMTLVFIFFGLLGADSKNTIVFYLASLITFMAIFCIIYGLKKHVKHAIYKVASIFNKDIALVFLKISWFTINSLKNITKKVNKPKLILYSVLTWTFNLLSCLAITNILSKSLYETTSLFFSGSGLASSATITVLQSCGGATVLMLFYIYGSGLLLYTSSCFIKLRYKKHKYVNLLPHQNSKDRLEFLKLYFDSNDDGAYFKQYLDANNDIAIIEDYSAGSNATTMLCSKGNKTFYRKYAFSDDAKKLNEQIKWIHAHEDKLTLTKITSEYYKDDVCYYDMPYVKGAVTCFNFVHTEPFDTAWSRIKLALDDLDKNLHQQTLRQADPSATKEYIASKVDKNLAKIKKGAFIEPLLEYDTLYINGKKYHNLKHYKQLLSNEHLLEVFKHDRFSDIHGDFTIENIICIKNSSQGYYIIDPNTGNLHDSPYLDYAKLLQSLHGGYEFLMNTKTISISGNHIDFLFTKSSTYYKLYDATIEYLEKKFKKEGMRSIFYHEIVHWLRLMPYKIEKNGERSVLFYAGLIMVLNDIEKRYPLKKGK